MTDLDIASRLIVAADFKPDSTGRHGVRAKILGLCRELKDTGVIIKINSILRAWGYGMIEEIHDYGLPVFADLKLNDISETMKIDGELLAEVKPELLTAMCSAGVKGLSALKAVLPHTELLGVTVLTSLEEEDSGEIYGSNINTAVMKLAKIADRAEIQGLVSSPKELSLLENYFGGGFSYNTPAIRPRWSMVEGDDQNPARSMTPKEALEARATRIVIGRPIVQAKSPRDAVMRTLEEMAG